MAKIYGQLERAQLQNLSADPSPAANGMVYYHTTLNQVKYYNGTSWIVLADLSTAQVITGKDIDGGTGSNTSRITIPKASMATLNALTRKQGTIVYASDQNKVYVDNGTSLVAVGSGTGSGTVNYLTGGDGEIDASFWSAFNTTFTSGVPGSITAGSTNVSVAQVSTNVLRGSDSLQLSCTTAAGSVGHGIISNAFTIADADLAKVLNATLEYRWASGSTAVDASGTSTQTVEIWVYNVGLGIWYQPAGFRGITTTTGTAKVSATFQTDSSNSGSNNQYRLALIIRNAPTSTFQLNFEGTVSPQSSVYGPAVSDWKSFTPTGSWVTNATYTGALRQVGDTLEMRINIALSGAPNATALTVTLPSGYTIDTSKVPGFITGFLPSFGHGLATDNTLDYNLTSYYGSTTTIGVGYQNNTNGATTIVNATLPFTWASGHKITLLLTGIPIVGWSSSSLQSADTDTRQVSASVSTSGSLTPGANVAIPFSVVNKDSHGSFTSGTGAKYTVPVSGDYQLAISAAAVTGTVPANVSIYKNGSFYGYIVGITAVSANFSGSALVPNLKAGDFLDIRIDAGSTILTGFKWDIFRLSGPSVITATDTVAAEYSYNGGGTTIASSTMTILKYDTKSLDKTGSYSTSTGLFTAPVSGTFNISASCSWAAFATGIRELAYSVDGGSSFKTLALEGNPSSANASMQTGSDIVSLIAGQTIGIYVQNTAGGGGLIVGGLGSRYNHFAINRVGN